MLANLEEDPQALYRLLAGQDAPWLAELAPSPAGRRGGRRPPHLRPSGLRARRALLAPRLRLAAEPLQRLTPLGRRGSALAGVFGAWASGSAAGRRLCRRAGRPREGEGPSGPSPGEWVAEAAAEGRLHRPGPRLSELAVRLSPPPPADQLGPVGDWTSLLPGVRGASKALSVIARGAAKQAEQKRRGLKSP